MGEEIKIPFPLKNIYIENFRGLKENHLKNLGKLNVLVGKNNTCKSTFLEAIHLGYSPFGNSFMPIFKRRGEKYPICIDYLFNSEPNEVKIHIESNSVKLNIKFKNEKSIAENIFEGYEEKFKAGKYFEHELEHLDNSTSTYARINYAISKELDQSAITRTGNSGLHKNRFPVKIIDTKYNLVNLMSSYSEVVKGNKIDELIKILKPVYDVNDVRIITLKGINVLYIEIDNVYLPISSCGEGLKWSLLLSSNIVINDKGILLIDDFENYHHLSSLKNSINVITNAIKNNNIQIFFTTHSLECIDYALKVSKEKNIDLKIIYLQKKGQNIISTVYNIEEAIESRNLIDSDLRGI